MKIEHRALRASEVRVDGDGHTVEADVLTYGMIDSYRTIFDEGVFDASMDGRMPVMAWSHDWADPIGRWVDWKNVEREGHTRLRLVGELDDFDAVPRARQAAAQLRSGTLRDFSVGFSRNDGGTYDDDDGVTHFRSASLDEVSIVLRGAVPGTKLVGVRSVQTGSRRQVPEEYLDHLAQEVESGRLTKAQALIAIDLAAGDTSEPPKPTEEPAKPSEDVMAAADEALAAFDAL